MEHPFPEGKGFELSVCDVPSPMKSASTSKISRRPRDARRTTAENLEEKFDAGQDVLDYFDPTKAVKRTPAANNLQLVLPDSLATSLDREAARVGVTPDALVKVWLAERLDRLTAPKAS